MLQRRRVLDDVESKEEAMVDRDIQDINVKLEEGQPLSTRELDLIDDLELHMREGEADMDVYAIVPDLLKSLNNPIEYRNSFLVASLTIPTSRQKIAFFKLPKHAKRVQIGDLIYIQRGVGVKFASRQLAPNVFESTLYKLGAPKVKSPMYDVYRYAEEWAKEYGMRSTSAPDLCLEDVVYGKARRRDLPKKVADEIISIIKRSQEFVQCESIQYLPLMKSVICRMLEDPEVLKSVIKSISLDDIRDQSRAMLLSAEEVEGLSQIAIIVRKDIPCGLDEDKELLAGALLLEAERKLSKLPRGTNAADVIRQVVKREKKTRGFSTQMEEELVRDLIMREYGLEKYEVRELETIARDYLAQILALKGRGITSDDIIEYMIQKRLERGSDQDGLDIIQSKMLCIQFGIDC